MNGKYIVFESSCGLEYPVLFPDLFVQDKDIKGEGKVVSAGLFYLATHSADKDFDATIEVSVWGSSDSLGVDARPEDAEIIRKQFTKK